MLRVVLDTVVFVRCLINPNGAAGRLVLQWDHRYQLIVSEPSVQEVFVVYTRPELVNKLRRGGPPNHLAVLRVIGKAEAVNVESIPAVSRGPNDDKILATALAGRADYLVTEDKDLLVLGSYHGTQIVTVGQFLHVLDDLAAEGG